jgi:predicted O-methyltransferase YrrM
MSDENPMAMLHLLERELSERRPFGDSQYILGQMQDVLHHYLTLIAPKLPIAGVLSDHFSQSTKGSLDRLIGDMVFRCSIVHAYIQIETGKPYGLPLRDCEAVLAAIVCQLDNGCPDAPLQDGTLERLGAEPYLGWIWSDEHSNDVFGSSFRYLVNKHYGAIPSVPNGLQISMLSKAVRLLQELLPTLAPSALIHARLAACVPNAGQWTGVTSASQFKLGGTLFISQSLVDPWSLAEHLLHESLHQKLYGFWLGHSLFEADSANIVRVLSPWNSPKLSRDNCWSTNRALAAFHVYVHLGLLAAVAEQRAAELEPAYGPFRGMISSRKALDRAHYLGEQIREVCWAELGKAGQRLVEWLISILDCLDPSPPPPNAYVHLCLDLYSREADQVEGLSQDDSLSSPSLAKDLISVAKDEVSATRTVLDALDADQELSFFSSAVDKYTDEELGSRFPDLRRLVIRTLMDVSLDGYRLEEAGISDFSVKAMVEKGSESIYSLRQNIPRGVAAAKRRANVLDFNQSCTDDVGRLLSMLCATVPAGGRVLEIGTGAGVGTAWMAAGIGIQMNVELVSVEVDSRLVDIARQWPWPPHVQILTADAVQVISGLGDFNLVFADAASFKFGHIGSVVQVLRPGGILVIDDLEVTTETSELERAKLDALRKELLQHRELRVVEMAWATGLALASKTQPS